MSWRSKSLVVRNNDTLINELKENGLLKDPEVEAVMRKLDRAHFTIIDPYTDSPQSIGYSATISAPHMHAMALEDLRPVLSEGRERKALDVGAGSGYMTAAMALLQGPPGMAPSRPGQAPPLVVGVEHIPQLAQQAIENITNDQPDLLTSGRLRIEVSDGRLGYPSEQPFDAIYVGAAAVKEPDQLVQQLAPGGRMVVPVGELGHQVVTLLQRGADGRLQTTKKMESVFVPLTDARTQWSAAQPPPPPPPAKVVATRPRGRRPSTLLTEEELAVMRASDEHDPDRDSDSDEEERRRRRKSNL